MKKQEEFLGKVLRGGMVTIPQNIRELLGIEERDMVRIIVEKQP